MIRVMIVSWISNRAHQDRCRRKAGLDGVGGQRIFYGGQCSAADVLVLEFKLVAEGTGNGLQTRTACPVTSGPMPSPGRMVSLGACA